jgi:alpha-D-xyloside xylohydrolase
MLMGEVPSDTSWAMTETEDGVLYRGTFGGVEITRDPWRVVIRDAAGRVLTSTEAMGDSKCLTNSLPMPFSFVRRAADLQRHFAASFTLGPDEMLFGGGESFTRLNKRGQKLVLWTSDAHGVQAREMYKPVPFFMSNRGYAMFVHTGAPITWDAGHGYDRLNTLYVGDDELDVFVFLGTPGEVLEEYTALTGRSPMPPLWSFGLWMSRITYKSEDETREVAGKLREERVPCDVIHLDTGWFETDWLCDYQFSPSRFHSPAAMIADLKIQGFRTSLWQLPYFTPANPLFPEIVQQGLAVRTADGNLPTEDAVLDFSNPAATAWYQDKLAGLLEIGVGAIKVDFGEGAPAHGVYASGRSGFHEHNLYPLRYNQAAFDVTKRITGDGTIWARSAWAGSQRYPLHWGGDAENTDSAMAATLRGGLSFGLCGFTFWSHDIGGFVKTSPEVLYARWMPFGMLTSHSRCHGAPPKEPWTYSPAFLDLFRKVVELKYRLMPYIYAQSAAACAHGHPLLRPLFFDYPEDRASWAVEDQYLLGHDLLVAPLMEEAQRDDGRDVYLPPGTWIDLQTGQPWPGAQWHHIRSGELPVVVLVRAGAALPTVPVVQSTDWIDWSRITLEVHGIGEEARALVCLPGEDVREVVVVRRDAGWAIADDPFDGRVMWTVTTGQAG